ncbi:SMI1/KNR4 family protein [Nocardia africana]
MRSLARVAPATSEVVAAAEARIGRSLPPSYRELLLTTDGWREAGSFVSRMRDTSEDAAVERARLDAVSGDVDGAAAVLEKAEESADLASAEDGVARLMTARWVLVATTP